MKLKDSLLMFGALASMAEECFKTSNPVDRTNYEDTPVVLTQKQRRRIRTEAGSYTPKPARKGAFKKKLSKKQRKQLNKK